MAVPAHLTLQTDGLPFDSLLSDWRWLVLPDFTPVLMTAFGDLFLRDQSGYIHFLDLMSGEFRQVAESQEEFKRLCEDRERRRSWFVGFLLTALACVAGFHACFDDRFRRFVSSRPVRLHSLSRFDVRRVQAGCRVAGRVQATRQ